MERGPWEGVVSRRTERGADFVGVGGVVGGGEHLLKLTAVNRDLRD